MIKCCTKVVLGVRQRACAEVTLIKGRAPAAIDRDVSSPDHTQTRNMQ
jgi:hypothetical protein